MAIIAAAQLTEMSDEATQISERGDNSPRVYPKSETFTDHHFLIAWVLTRREMYQPSLLVHGRHSRSVAIEFDPSKSKGINNQHGESLSPIDYPTRLQFLNAENDRLVLIGDRSLASVGAIKFG